MATGLLERLKGDLAAYRPIPFWSWNDALKPERLRRQIDEMAASGMGGFFMHARGGLETEYMGEDWMNCVKASAEQAEKRGMRAWMYDENGWPSGFAGMKLLEDSANHAHYLEFSKKDSYDPQALGCFRVNAQGELEKLTDDDGEGCFAVYDRTNPSVVDILSWQIVRKFLTEIHEQYYKRFGKLFGKVLAGFFTDEPQYFRYATAYSPALRQKYKAKYNEDVLDVLGALFLDCAQAPRVRYRYWLTMNELYTESFAGQIYRWCEEHGCELTGHTIEESSLFGAMACCGGVMPFYEYEHIPGMDWLGRHIGTEVSPRQVSSVAMQLGKKQIITETFAGCGWDVTPRELKRIAEWQYVNGVNLLCHHLYPYSIRGQRKRDYPAFYSNHNPWAKAELRRFNDYFTRLGYMLAESEEVADTLVIHPMHSAFLTFDRNDRQSVAALNDAFNRLAERLGASGILHHYADEALLKKYGSVQGRKLHLGKCSYSQVVVPEMDCIDQSTLELLFDFAKAGGRLCFAGAKPQYVEGEKREIALEGNISLSQLKNPNFGIDETDTDIRYTLRRAEFGEFVYAVNLSATKKQSAVFYVKCRAARRFDLEKPGYAPLYYRNSERGIDIPLELEPGQSIVIFLSSTAPAGAKPEQTHLRRITGVQGFVQRADANTLTIDRARLSLDGESYGEEMDVMALSDLLLRQRQNRTIYLKYTFRVQARPESLRLEAEDMNGATVCLNGETLTRAGQGEIEESFNAYDIAPHIRLGENELVFRVDYYQPEHVYKVFNGVYYDHDGTTESLINCLSYHTDIESVYLRGDFCVGAGEYTPGAKQTLKTDGSFYLTLPRRYVTLDRMAQDGFPFFGGSVTLRTILPARGNERVLKLEGRWHAARVSINGGSEKTLLFGDALDVSGELQSGDNEVIITLISSMRNTLGPFHLKNDPEPTFTGPDNMSNYGAWRDGQPANYTPAYSFTFFGISAVLLG